MLDACKLRRGGRIPRGRAARAARGGALSGAQPRPQPRRPAARRSPPARRARRLLAMVAHYGLDTVRAYMGHVQDNAAESVRRAIAGSPTASVRDAHRRRRARSACRSRSTRGAQRDARLHRLGRPARQQLQRAARDRRRGGALRVPHPGGRRHPAERRLPRAAQDGDPARARCCDPRPPAATVAGNVETSQHVVDALYGALGVMAAPRAR